MSLKNKIAKEGHNNKNSIFPVSFLWGKRWMKEREIKKKRENEKYDGQCNKQLKIRLKKQRMFLLRKPTIENAKKV